MRNLLFTALVFVGAASFAFAQQPLSPADVKSLLERIRAKRAAAPYMQANFQEERALHLMSKPIVTSGKVWFQAPNKFRQEVRGSLPSVAVSDGQQLWIYYPNFKLVEHYSLGRGSPVNAGIAAVMAALNLENVEATYYITASRIGSPQAGYELELLPRTPSMKRIFQKFNLGINDELFLTRTEMLKPNGDRITTTYSNQSGAPIPESTFMFTPPPGTEVTTPLGR
jgi:outer membrane lipoprotein carrier protein